MAKRPVRPWIPTVNCNVTALAISRIPPPPSSTGSWASLLSVSPILCLLLSPLQVSLLSFFVLDIGYGSSIPLVLTYLVLGKRGRSGGVSPGAATIYRAACPRHPLISEGN
ncbi:hypothetical protein BO94DRAFT_284813 [Aspergillus sclerotioniger CBS 115572]|uniref:Uncharacterized protein n=1 Tax=Aspergillus sclerotioniger CBS 115572 TaxID=1450535 RepID=A0A317XCX1_9EURO|nr:hypothetical protein BO94DRAFT_284813 [Aspergillus sclerotioniger CBS 115572]PWY94798.1 hypothetical protein BO94DRAFT_284813 [Aspergillus sclerotioniger CBS 115572]